MNNNVIVNLPMSATDQINYMSVLSGLENYAIPSSPYLSVQEFIASKMYNWYLDMVPENKQWEDLAWYTNYE